MKARIYNGEFKKYNRIPSTWGQTSFFHLEDESVWEANGFYDLLRPNFDTETHMLGTPYYDDVANVITFTVEARPVLSAQEKEDAKQSELFLARNHFTEGIVSNFRLRKAIDDYIIDGTPIPQNIIDQRQSMIQQYNIRRNQIIAKYA